MSDTKSLATINTTHQMGAFSGRDAFESAHQMATLLGRSDLVPDAYRGEKGVANGIIAIELAQRIGMSPLMVMQHLHVIHGRPSWSATFLIAALNASRRFSPLRFRLSDLGPEREYEYWYTEYQAGNKSRRKGTVRAQQQTCRAIATDLASGEVLEGTEVSIEMAIKEGWYTRDGSKWLTMREQMLRYRAAAFFARLYAPEISMGLMTQDEAADAGPIDVQAEVVAPRQTMGDVRVTSMRTEHEDTPPGTTKTTAESKRRGRKPREENAPQSEQQSEAPAEASPPSEDAAPPEPPAPPSKPVVPVTLKEVYHSARVTCERLGLPYPAAASAAIDAMGGIDITNTEQLEQLLAKIEEQAK